MLSNTYEVVRTDGIIHQPSDPNDLNLADSPARHAFSAAVFPASTQRWPVVGPIVFGQNALVYASWALVIVADPPARIRCGSRVPSGRH